VTVRSVSSLTTTRPSRSARWETDHVYGEAAQFYDLIQRARGRDPDAEADVVVREIRRGNPQARTMLDVACGTGANLPRFAESFDVVGLDASADMLAIAREKCPDVSFVEADMRSFDLGRRFDAIVCIFSGIGYLVEETDLRQAVLTMATHLHPGGVLAIEGWVEPSEWSGPNVSVDSCQAEGLALARVTTSSAEGMRSEFTSRYTWATGSRIDSIDEHHVLRLSDPGEFASAFAAADLSFNRLPHLLRPGRALYVGVAATTRRSAQERSSGGE
jgi:SAM-dependent methyltransferase